MGNYLFNIVEYVERTEYYFQIDEPLLYCVSFKKSFWVAIETSYEIHIQNSLNLPNSIIFDPRLMPTIVEIIKHFLSQSEKNSVTYICDSSDTEGRSAARARLFKVWFQKYNTEQFFHIQSKFHNKKKEQTFYTGLLYHADYSDIEKINRTFDTINQELNK